MAFILGGIGWIRPVLSGRHFQDKHSCEDDRTHGGGDPCGRGFTIYQQLDIQDSIMQATIDGDRSKVTQVRAEANYVRVGHGHFRRVVQ